MLGLAKLKPAIAEGTEAVKTAGDALRLLLTMTAVLLAVSIAVLVKVCARG